MSPFAFSFPWNSSFFNRYSLAAASFFASSLGHSFLCICASILPLCFRQRGLLHWTYSSLLIRCQPLAAASNVTPLRNPARLAESSPFPLDIFQVEIDTTSAWLLRASVVPMAVLFLEGPLLCDTDSGPRQWSPYARTDRHGARITVASQSLYHFWVYFDSVPLEF